MPLFTKFVSPSVLAISALTAAGLFVHDMELEKMTRASLVLPVASATYKIIEGGAQLSETSHTHSDSSAEPVQHLRSVSSTRMLPRDDNRKYVLSKKVVKGVHPFDGYYLPSDLPRI